MIFHELQGIFINIAGYTGKYSIPRGNMKKFLYALVLILSCTGLCGKEADFFVCSKISAVIGMAVVRENGMTHFYFKLLPDSKAEIDNASIYLSTDRDPKTGRRGYGCEYYMNAKKRSVTYYDKEGKMTGFSKAFTITHIDDWCIWSFADSVFAQTPLDDMSLTWKGVKKQGHIRAAAGKGLRKVIIPEITKQ